MNTDFDCYGPVRGRVAIERAELTKSGPPTISLGAAATYLERLITKGRLKSGVAVLCVTQVTRPLTIDRVNPTFYI